MRQLQHIRSRASLSGLLACLYLASAPLNAAADTTESAASNYIEAGAKLVTIVKPVSPKPASPKQHRPTTPARRRRAPAPIPITRQQLLSPPPESVQPPLPPVTELPPPSPLPVEYAYHKTRPHVTGEGLVLGDFVLSPRVYFSTDNRYDDANVRERAMREDIDYFFEARRRGELREDPVSAMFHNWQRDPMNLHEPSMHIANSIHEILQSALHSPILTLRPDLFLQRRTEVVTTPMNPSASDQAAPQSTTRTPASAVPVDRPNTQPQSLPLLPAQPGQPERTAP